MNIKKLIILTLSFALAVGCKIVPKSPSQTVSTSFRVKPAAPKNFSVPNIDVDNSGLTVSWENEDEVDGFFVFYQTGDEYIKGEQPNAVNLPKDEISYTFSSLDEAERYVFYAKSYKVVSGEVIFSDSSDVKESATKPTLSMTTTMNGKNSATLHFATSERSSVLNVGKYIYTPVFEVYSDKADLFPESNNSEDEDGDDEDANGNQNALIKDHDIHPMIAENFISRNLHMVLQTKKEVVTIPFLNPSESVFITFDMFVENHDGSLTSVETVPPEATIDNPVDMYPQPIVSSSFDDTMNGSIKVKFTPSPINNGILAEGEEEGERVSQVYTVEKSLSGANEWETIISEKNGDNSGKITKNDDGTMEFTDHKIVANKKYDYRITPNYVVRKEKTGNLSEVFYKCEDSHMVEGAMCLQEPVKLYLKIAKEDRSEPNYSSSVKAYVPFLVDGMTAEISRINAEDGTTEKVAEDVPVKAVAEDDGDADGNSAVIAFKDDFSIKKSDDLNTRHTYYYGIKLKKGGNASAEKYTPRDVTWPANDPIDLLTGATFSDTSANAGRVEMIISAINDNELTKDGRGIEKDKIMIYVRRGFSPQSIADTPIKTMKLTELVAADCKIVDDFSDIENASEIDNREYFYQIKAVIEQDGSTYNGLSTMISSDGVRTLAYPVEAEAENGLKSDGIIITFSTVHQAAGYDVYYKLADDANDTYHKAEGDLIEIDAEMGVATFKKDVGTPNAGRKYSFRIYAKDSNGNCTKEYAECTGSLFGLYNFNVAATQSKYNDKIVVSWSEVPNVTRYDVDVYADEALQTCVTHYRGKKSDREFVFNASDVNEDLFDEGYPLNHEFWFLVTPVMPAGTSVDKNILSKVRGSWIMPPKNIRATKGDYAEEIRIEWDPVEDAKGYYVYRRELGLTQWTMVGSVMHSEGCIYKDPSASVNKKYEYSVASINQDLKHSLPQSFFVKNENNENSCMGFLLSPPETVLADESVTEYYTIDVTVPYLYTGLRLNMDGYNQDFEKNDDGSWKAPANSNTTISFNDRGNIVITTKRSKLKNVLQSYSQNISVMAINNGQVSSPRTVNVKPKTLLPVEIVELLHSMLINVIPTINSSFGGDWWPQGWFNQQKTYTAEGIEARSELGGSNNPSRTSKGYVAFSGYIDPNTNCSFTTTQSIKVGVSDEGGAGYLGNDVLEYLGWDRVNDASGGKIDITLPGDYGTANVTFGQIKVSDTTTGSYSVTYKGKTTNVNKSDLNSDLRKIL